MNILLANKFFHLNGGSEQVFFQERNFLLAQGHRVLDFSMADARNQPSSQAEYFAPHIAFEGGGGGRLKQALAFIHSRAAVRQLERLLAREQPEIAHLHNIYHQLTPAIIPVLQRHGVKVVLTLHDYKLICPSYLALRGEEICTACGGRRFLLPLLVNCQRSRARGLLLTAEALWHQFRRSYGGVDLFIAPSRFLAELTGQRIAAEKIRVLRNGIDLALYPPNYGDQGYILYFGRLSKEKGIETLLRGHGRLSRSMPLKVVGTGPLAEELRRHYPHAEFLGYQSGQVLKELVAQAAMVVVPSEWLENCSMVVLEAMALGKPIIGSRVGGIPEQIDEGRTGFLFTLGNEAELAEKIEILAADPGLRGRMGQAARKKLEEEYSLAAHEQGLLRIYGELLASS